MIGSLFIRSYERSERIYAAMLARGFAGEMRTLTHLTWQARDTRAGLAWLAVLATIAVLGRMTLLLPARGF
jgi:cobalt/nickel transport system permease protein